MFLWGLGQNHPRSISADMTGDAGQNINTRARMNVKAKLARTNFNGGINRKGERRTTKFNRIDPKQQMVHHRIADKHNFQNILRVRPACSAAPEIKLCKPSMTAAVISVTAGIHDPIGNTAHQILAKADLWVHRTG